MTTTKQCGICKIAKPLEEFGRDKSRSDGRFLYCSTCNAARVAAKRAENRSAPAMSNEEFVGNIDFRWKRVDGREDDFHYRWTGAYVLSGSQTPLQRFAVLIGEAKPPNWQQMWCQDEAPGCVNPDHLMPMGGVQSISTSEVFSEEGEHFGFQIAQALTDGVSLTKLEQFWDTPDASEKPANDFLHDHGFDRNGEPLKRGSRND